VSEEFDFELSPNKIRSLFHLLFEFLVQERELKYLLRSDMHFLCPKFITVEPGCEELEFALKCPFTGFKQGNTTNPIWQA